MAPARALTYDECLRRLDDGGLGRVAITEHALPVIVPVSFARAGAAIVFRTEPDGLLARRCDGAVVAFEIDGTRDDAGDDAGDDAADDAADDAGAVGWTVLVVGVAQLLDNRDGLVAIDLGRVSGREIPLGTLVPAESGLCALPHRGSPRQG